MPQAELNRLKDAIDPDCREVQSFCTTNFHGSVTYHPNAILARDTWVVSATVLGNGHLIHTFATKGNGSSLETAFSRLEEQLNSLCRHYGKGYKFRDDTGRCTVNVLSMKW